MASPIWFRTRSISSGWIVADQSKRSSFRSDPPEIARKLVHLLALSRRVAHPDHDRGLFRHLPEPALGQPQFHQRGRARRLRARPPDATAQLLAAVRQLWDDPAEYAKLSESALKFSQRPEIQPAYQARQFLDVLGA